MDSLDYKQILNAVPQGVCVVSEVRDDTGKLIDCKIEFTNIQFLTVTNNEITKGMYYTSFCHVLPKNFSWFDIFENVRFYSSSEYKNGSVIYGLVDMDLTMNNHQSFAVGFQSSGADMHWIIPQALLRNAEFKNAFLTRLGALLRSEMSDEAVLERIEKLRAIAAPETARDLARWNLAANTFDLSVERLRTFTTGRAREMASAARGYFGLTQDQAAQYFGPLA